MAIKTVKTNDLVWMNIDKIDEEAMKLLKKYKFHHLDIEDVEGESQNPKIDTYRDYLFLVVQFPQWSAEKKAILVQELNIFVGEGYLITIQQTKSKEMNNFFYRCMRNKRTQKDWLSSTSGYLLYKLLESLYKNSQPILNNIGKKLSELESRVFEFEVQDSHTVRELAIHRRNILSFRRFLDPQRYLISNLSHIRKPFLNEETTLYFDDVNDYLTKLWAIVDTYRDTIEGLHVTVESLITQRTNKVVGTLTVISVGLLPFTVLSGIYGMNIVGLPYAKDNPMVVWMMFGGLAVFVLIAIAIMRNRKWL